MKKTIKKIISITFVLSIITSLGTSVQASVIHEPNTTILAASEKKMINSYFDEKIEVKDITREEYLKTYAEKKGISIEEADKLEKLDTEKSIRDEINSKAEKVENFSLREGVTTKETISAMSPIYRQVARTFDTGKGIFNSRVVVVIDVKINRFTSTPYGTYQKFAEVLDKGADAFGSGKSNLNLITLSADIYGDTGYENKINMMLSGNLVHETTFSGSAGAQKADFSVELGVDSTYICRKFITLSYVFTSNWDLN